MARVISSGTPPVNDGERRVIQLLREKLPDSYTLFPNVELMAQGRSYDLDVIVVAPHAIYAVEIKDWGGLIVGDDRTWLLSDGKEWPSPYPSIAHKSRVLKGYLSKKGPSFHRLWVQGIVVVARRETQLDLDDESRQWIVTLDEAVAALADRHRSPQMAQDPIYQQAVISLQGGVKARPDRPRRLGKYELIDEIRNEEGLVEYRARHVDHASNSRFRLRVREISAYLPEAERLKIQERIRRDYDAMDKLGPHPNLVRVREFFREDEQYVEVSDWSEAGTLAGRLKQGPSFTWTEKRQIMEGLANAVAFIHDHGIMHRDIQALNVLLTMGGTPQLMNFDRAYVPAQQTVWMPQGDTPARSHLPPELIGVDYDAALSSDVYSLGVLFHELLVGRRPYSSPGEAVRLGAMPPLSEATLAGVPEGFPELLAAMCNPRMEDRISNGREVVDRLNSILHPQAPSEVADPGVSAPVAKATYQPNDMIGRDYFVQQVLGRGTFSHVYKVINVLSEEEWAIKIFWPHVDVRHLQEEFKHLRKLNHDHIAKVHDVGLTAAGEYYMLLEYVDGQTLDQFTSRENRLGLESSIDTVKQLLTALDYLHGEGRIHRDIKPTNLILGSGHVLKVIDFNVAADSGVASSTLTGTPAYLPPDLYATQWVNGCDLFAAGVVLYELVLGQHPYDNREPRAGRLPKDPLSIDPTLSDSFATILRKAVAPLATDRYGSASEFLADLVCLAGEYRRPVRPVFDPALPVIPIEPHERDRHNYNPCVSRLLTMYSQAQQSNRGTRGYDEVAKATYVRTRLDEELRADVLAGKFRLVIITGNAGDGKTAFIQALEADAAKLGFNPQRMHSGNGTMWRGNGCSFETNWDGSQDEGDRSSDGVLSEFFSPFTGEVPRPDSEVVRIVGINEGRLRDFLYSHAGEFRGLKEDLERFFECGETQFDWLLVVNLNWRSLVAGEEESIFEKQLNALLAPHLWDVCEACQYASQCYVKFNVDSLRDPDHGPAARARMRHLFAAVHLRGALHITMRDLRSALAYVLLRDRDCSEIATFLQEASPKSKLSQLYYNGFWEQEAGAPRDRLVVQLADLDPALTTEPLLDRRLQARPESLNWLAFSNRHAFDTSLLEQLRHEALLQAEGEAGTETGLLYEPLRIHHAMMRRKAFFELHTDRWRSMVPYGNLELFQASLGNSRLREEQRKNLLKALSWAHGMDTRYGLPSGFYMRASAERNPSVRTYRFFPEAEFQLEVLARLPWMRYIEYEPHYLILRHADSRAELKITLDVFEFLGRVGEGYTPTSSDRRGPYLNVELFEHALSHRPYGQLLLEENRSELIVVSASGQGELRVERWQENG